MNMIAPSHLQWVRTYSRNEFRELMPNVNVAAISIQDDQLDPMPLEGWRATWQGFFTDVEYDMGYVQRWGWRNVGRDGLFLPEMAESLNAFLASEGVRSATGLVIHCHAGRSRSVAVGLHVARMYGCPLTTTKPREPNKTVAALLANPACLGTSRPPPAPSPPSLGHRLLSALGLAAP